MSDDNGQIEIYYWTGSDLSDNEVVLDTVNELTETQAQKRNTMLELFKLGLFHDENGRLPNRIRYKLLDGLGFGMWDYAEDERVLQTKRADAENINMTPNLIPNEFDDHIVHIEEHKKFLLSDECQTRGEGYIKMLTDHIKAHKQMSIPDGVFNSIIKQNLTNQNNNLQNKA